MSFEWELSGVETPHMGASVKAWKKYRLVTIYHCWKLRAPFRNTIFHICLKKNSLIMNKKNNCLYRFHVSHNWFEVRNWFLLDEIFKTLELWRFKSIYFGPLYWNTAIKDVLKHKNFEYQKMIFRVSPHQRLARAWD